MIANNDMSRWCVLYTAPKSERKLVQRLHAAGYMAFCPMQIVFKKWKGQTKRGVCTSVSRQCFCRRSGGCGVVCCFTECCSFGRYRGKKSIYLCR